MVDKKEGKKDIGEGLGIAGLTLGILSIVFAGWLGIILAIIGFVFCHIQQKRNPTKIGKAGWILNIIGLVVSVVFLIVYIKYLVPALIDQGALVA